ncbi:RNA pseudouridine synthase [Campylobacter blaseri]|uniref:RNA pseudouridylate synthase n=1 Tax=Campylobacter blaseri TaxID=2042961 RepID=A0A2P8R3E4_9BACT|nr:RluA family pseudouridine synthase [Campylobacter blaseri]PSM53017.1 RNA pseudouridine synthase [Campylobacter blaseri]PSM54484.1 RNA pseudouridine synthase [Campylobacter blaseri]QKF85271.1 RNA pseudouridine synthase [Campylobacter blaseri]
MPYIKRKIANVKFKKAYQVLLDSGFSMSESQKLIDKKRLFDSSGIIVGKNKIINGDIYLVEYECKPKGLKPIFENNEFAIFNKPSGVLSHPNGRNCEYSLYDEIWSLYGKNAAIAHRLDKETSGLIVVAKDIISQKELKKIFEKREVSKKYIALVCGKTQEEFEVKAKIGQSDKDIRIKMVLCENGKESYTKFKRLKYLENLNISLVEAAPITGRQHQIRVHLFHVKHRILGDPLYGLQIDDIEKIISQKMTKNERVLKTGINRLCLHASEISFKFRDEMYNFKNLYEFQDEILYLNSLLKSSSKILHS